MPDTDIQLMKESKFTSIKQLGEFLQESGLIYEISPYDSEELLGRIREVELEADKAYNNGHADGLEQGFADSQEG